MQKLLRLYRTLRFIFNHPLNQKNKLFALYKFINWQFFNLKVRHTIIHNYIENSKIIVQKGMVGATGNYYCGLDEFTDMAFLLHFLRNEDSFFDIGANIGSYTILASSCVGCNSVTIEPVPLTYSTLLENIEINHIENKVIALNIGLGNENGTIKFTSDLDSTNHVATQDDKSVIQVKFNRLDDIAIIKDQTVLVKIDVEGYEFEVLKGGSNFFSKPNVKAIIIEMNGSGIRYGVSDYDIHQQLTEFGYSPYTYKPFKRELIKCDRTFSLNTIYVRDIDFVNERVNSSRTFKVNEISF